MSGINGPVTDPAGLGKRPSGAARHILRSASNSSCGSSISSSGAYQRAAPDMMQRPNAEQLKPQMFCSVGNGNINNEDMPYLEDVDVVPALEYDDGSTDEQPRNGINGDLGTTYGRGHHLGQPYGNDYACGELALGRISQVRAAPRQNGPVVFRQSQEQRQLGLSRHNQVAECVDCMFSKLFVRLFVLVFFGGGSLVLSFVLG